ncbi:hypothetical protein RCL_jg10067.t1 [Rhizophagus clarus]|uniref:Uncharacterized protein n=1 Tax=Rhizophagus clarus TaxID=94130 RepID=A0A8H3QCA2_9GLOM|nr:hypothetical protein RCL_jg10067.t1 [Rhizophagus clarus]
MIVGEMIVVRKKQPVPSSIGHVDASKIFPNATGNHNIFGQTVENFTKYINIGSVAHPATGVDEGLQDPETKYRLM